MRDDPQLNREQCLEHRGHQRPKHGELVAWGVTDDDRERKVGECLLILEAAIDGQKDVESHRCELQQHAVLRSGPSGFSNGRDLVTRKLLA
jgi:hypothetical protein